MAKTIKIKNVGSCTELHRDPRTGIAWVKDCRLMPFPLGYIIIIRYKVLDGI